MKYIINVLLGGAGLRPALQSKTIYLIWSVVKNIWKRITCNYFKTECNSTTSSQILDIIYWLVPIVITFFIAVIVEVFRSLVECHNHWVTFPQTELSVHWLGNKHRPAVFYWNIFCSKLERCVYNPILSTSELLYYYNFLQRKFISFVL